MSRLKRLQHLRGAQRDAVDPQANVWLAASAGTGKTHVLSSRVLRLLLRGADPSAILCLTFTKAGAAEMAERIHARLADWVRLRDDLLAIDLAALGENFGPDDLPRARRLFARVLDAPGGGLRIQTIHAFAATLLAGFPEEAGLVPGFRPMEEREETVLAATVLADMLVDAENGGDLPLIADVQTLSRRLGEEGAQRFLRGCARAPDAMAALGPAQGIEPQLRRAMDVPSGDVEAALAEACADERFDCATLARIAAANAAWGTKTGLGHADTITAWRAASPEARAATLEALASVFHTGKGEPRAVQKGQIAAEADYVALAARLGDACKALVDLRAKAGFAAMLAAALRAGQAYADRYTAAKRAAGLVDFDDLIRRTVSLLQSDGIADWVRYKLDQATDHILVDEAQDTNVDQWSIVAALAGDFFAGEGARQGVRTIFTVGDFKQAIFGFQGTDPQAFAAARLAFETRADAADRAFANLALEQSFRSTPPVLELVDRLLDEIGGEKLGLIEPHGGHRSARDGLPGRVTLWRPHTPAGPDEEGEAEGEEGWLDDATRSFATLLAKQVREWIYGPAPLHLAASGRALKPEDVMILVRKRGALAALIVARLHAEGVPVAGVDRLRLTAPLAVKDLLAAIRFVLQPEDDLNLAGLLVSPLFGLSQDDLFAIAYGRRGSLLSAVSRRQDFAATADALNALLATADFGTPYRFLEAILSDPMDGRRKLLERLGEEARDPIEELLNAALAFEDETTPSLQLFLDWFDRGDIDIKRDPSAPLDAVRVMTVHGAKGLQAPLVILADATLDPDDTSARSIHWEREGAKVPIVRPRKAERFAPFADAIEQAERKEREEHWRLLYVALTRAEEHLVIGGALNARRKGAAPAESWHAAVERAMAALGAEPEEDARWGAARHHAGGTVRGGGAARRVASARPLAPTPDWLRRAAPEERRPPRPLAPSSLGPDDVADPPPSPALAAAAERGRLLHALFERLPAIAPERRRESAERWLVRSAGVAPEDAAALAADACAIIADPRFADIFGPDALAEAPIAAVVEGAVIAGTVDRLLVTDRLVRVVDFKTGRRAPVSLDAVPAHHLRQIAAYAAALATIFPGRVIEAGLLYTAGPHLIAVPDAVIAAHKPGYPGGEQSLRAVR